MFLTKEYCTVSDFESSFRPVGEATVAATNQWFTVVQQPMDFVSPNTGELRRSAADGGQMNFVDIAAPGVLVVTDIGGRGTLLMSQERYPTNLVEGHPVRHYELPGGGIDAEDKGSEAAILAAAEVELRQELGYKAGELILLGSRHRGLLAHPSMTDHNFTVLARGAEALHGGAEPEATEALGAPEFFTWRQTEDMYLDPSGLYIPDRDHMVISSAPTVASLALAQRWIERQAELGPKYL